MDGRGGTNGKNNHKQRLKRLTLYHPKMDVVVITLSHRVLVRVTCDGLNDDLQ